VNGLLATTVATALDSLVGLVGIFSLYISEKRLRELVQWLVAFAAGAMLAGALVHMIPKAMLALQYRWTGEVAIIGFLTFLALERFLNWHHCHKTGPCEVHPVTTLTIVGDSLHNFIDGLVIAAAFLTDVATGWITTALIIAHEVPQELGNFSVLVFGGYRKEKAILWTFLSQATCILGGLIGWFFTPSWLKAPVIAFAAGGFLYIAAADLIPELHKEKDRIKMYQTTLWLLLGILFMIGIKMAVHG